MCVCVCVCVRARVCVCVRASLTVDLGNSEARLGTQDFKRYRGNVICVSY